jgi:hypothetical protein
MRSRFLRYTLIAPVLLLLLMLTAGTAGASSVSHPSVNLNSVRVLAHHYTPKHLHVTKLTISNSGGTHYLYVDDGGCPDSIDVYKITSSLTHVGSYNTDGCIAADYYGSDVLAVARANKVHGACLLYSSSNSSSFVNYVASFPINADGSLGTETADVNTASGGAAADLVVRNNNTLYESNPGYDIESYSIGAGCALTYEASASASSVLNIGIAIVGNDLLSADTNTSNLDNYKLGKNGAITFKSSQTGQISNPASIATQMYHGHVRAFTGQTTSSAPQVQGGKFLAVKGTFSFLNGSPASDPSGSDGAAVFAFKDLLVQGEQLSATLANYSIKAKNMSFVSETHMAVSGTAPNSFAKDGNVLFVDGLFYGDIEGCSISVSGVSNCATVATLTNPSGLSLGMALY